MKLRSLNKKIKARERNYYDTCDRINDRFGKEMKKLDNFRSYCIEQIFRLKDKDRTLIKYYSLKDKLKKKVSVSEVTDK